MLIKEIIIVVVVVVVVVVFLFKVVLYLYRWFFKVHLGIFITKKGSCYHRIVCLCIMDNNVIFDADYLLIRRYFCCKMHHETMECFFIEILINLFCFMLEILFKVHVGIFIIKEGVHFIITMLYK